MDLKIEDLSIGYGNKTILSDVNLVFKPKIIAIIGPNGAGKSTLIKAIAGINKVKKGLLVLMKEKLIRIIKNFIQNILDISLSFYLQIQS